MTAVLPYAAGMNGGYGGGYSMGPHGPSYGGYAPLGPHGSPALFSLDPTAAYGGPLAAGGDYAHLFGVAPSPSAAYPAAAAGYLSAGGPAAALADIRTIFVSGLPNDVKDRELHNLLRHFAGYEASQMNWKTGSPQGFALFSTPAHARAGVEAISGLAFDEGVVLRAEIARKNMFLKPEDPSVKHANRHSPTLLGPPTLMSPGGTLMSPGGPVGPLQGSPLSPAGPAFLAAAAAANAAANAAVGVGSPTGMALLSPMPLLPATFSPVTNLRDNPPCNTLFIGNLGDNTNEQELRALMSIQPGYRQLKLVRGPKSTTAFVEFLDVTAAMLVHDTLQGAVLSSSDRGGIRIQYSKNPFGRREAGSSPSAAALAGGHPAAPDPDAFAAAYNGHGGVYGGQHSPHGGGGPLGDAAGLMAGMAAQKQPGGVGVSQGMVAPGGPSPFIGQAGMEHVLGGDV